MDAKGANPESGKKWGTGNPFQLQMRNWPKSFLWSYHRTGAESYNAPLIECK
jgi:hypothetical protein